MASKDDLLFAQTAVHNKLATEEQARQCLEAITKAKEIGVTAKIEDIFVNKGILTEAQVRAIMKGLGRTRTEKISVIGDFRITGKLGEGGMGIVYRAKQISLDREVALKILPPRLASDSSFVDRFHREARAVARLNHSNIIQVYAAGVDKGYHYMAMEFVDGATTMDILRRQGKFSEKAAVKLLLEMASALQHAHKDGIIHRDIKPDNIMLTKEGVAKLADLGLAKENLSASVTQTGTVVGTPRYMSPEQAAGNTEVDGRSDLYSLGVSVYHLLTGVPPFEDDNIIKLLMRHVNEKPAPLRSKAPQLSAGLCNIVERLLQKKPAERFQNAAELQVDLEHLQRGQPLPPAPPPVSDFPELAKDNTPNPFPSQLRSAEESTPSPATGGGLDFLDKPSMARPLLPQQPKEDLSFSEPLPSAPSESPSPATAPIPWPKARPRTRFPVIAAGIVLGILLVLGVIAYFSFQTEEGTNTPILRFRSGVPEEVSSEYRKIMAQVDASPAEYAANIEQLGRMNPEWLDEEAREEKEARIREMEQKANEEGREPFLKLKNEYQRLLEQKHFLSAQALLDRPDSFPQRLRVPSWNRELQLLREDLQSRAESDAKQSLSALQSEIAQGNRSKVLEMGSDLLLKELERFAPVEVQEIQKVLDDAVASLQNDTIEQSLRPVLMDLHNPLDKGDIFLSADVAGRILKQDELWNQLRFALPNARLDFLRDELTALGEIRGLALDYLKASVGKEVKLKGISMKVLAFKDGMIDLGDPKGTWPDKKNEPVSSWIRGAEFGTMAASAYYGNREIKEDLVFEWKLAVFYLLLGDSMNAEKQFTKLPPEQSGPYQKELALLAQSRQMEKEMTLVSVARFSLGVTQQELEKIMAEISVRPGTNTENTFFLRPETPPRAVELKPFFIDRQEVSTDRYAAFLNYMIRTGDHSLCRKDEAQSKDHKPKFWLDGTGVSEKKDLPVVGIDWFDACAFAAWAGRRLPTEAEWECAASWWPDGRKTEYPWGAKFLAKNANLSKGMPSATGGMPSGEMFLPGEMVSGLKPVNSFSSAASPSGCLNLSGNAWEWIADLNMGQLANQPEIKALLGTGETAGFRILRGGGFRSPSILGRSTTRVGAPPLNRDIDIGFRCAADPPSFINVRIERYRGEP